MTATTAPDGRATSRRDLRTVLTSCVMGTTVEWYDFFLYGVAAGSIFNKQYFPSEDPTVGTLLSFATFAIGFVARPVGGLVFGHIGDRVGRKRTLVMTMLIMGIATFLIGCLPTYAQIGVAAPILLIVLRLLQGVAIGGEWGGAVLMSVEYAPPGRRALFGSVPQMGLAVGLMLGTGVFALGQWLLSDTAFASWGWRIAFWLSLILVVIGLVIRLKVMETPAFRTLEKTEAKATVPALDLVRDRASRRNLFLGMGARWVEGVAFNAWAVFSISYATNTLDLAEGPVLLAVMVSAMVLLVMIPIWGMISDRWTAKRTYAIGAALSALVPIISFPMLESRNTLLLSFGILLALAIVYPIMYAPEASFFADMFKANVRYSGISVVYQMSGIVASGLTPLVLTWLLDARDGGFALIIVYFLITGAISVVCTLLVRPAVSQDGADAQLEPGLAPEVTGDVLRTAERG